MTAYNYITKDNIKFHLDRKEASISCFRGEISVSLFDSPVLSICYTELSNYIKKEHYSLFDEVAENYEDGVRYIDYSYFDVNINSLTDIVLDYIEENEPVTI